MFLTNKSRLSPKQGDISWNLKKCVTSLFVNQSISENLPQVVYTTTEKAHVPENQQLVVHEATVDGQALNRYTWREKLDAVSVLEIDSFIAIVAAMIYAVLEQWKRKEKKNNEVG